MGILQLLDDLNSLRAKGLTLTAFNAHIRSLIFREFPLVGFFSSLLTVIHDRFVVELENTWDLDAVGAGHTVLTACADGSQ